MKKKTTKKKPITARAPGLATAGIVGHKSKLQLALYLANRLNKTRSQLMFELIDDLFKKMKESKEHSHALRQVNEYFDPNAKCMAYSLPAEIKNFRK